MWDEQGWRRRFTGDTVPTATDLLEVIEIISHRLHDPSLPIDPWKRRDGCPGWSGQFEKDDEIAPHYLVRGWFGAEDEEVAVIEGDGKPPDVRWVSEDVLLNAIERHHDPTSDATLLELLTDRLHVGRSATHTGPRARSGPHGQRHVCTGGSADKDTERQAFGRHGGRSGCSGCSVERRA
eukprot:7384557-Prymnesium_polylepis.1